MELWLNGTQVQLQLAAPEGTLLAGNLPLMVAIAKISDMELVRFTYEVVDPESGETRHGAARLVVEELPDPRTPCATCATPRALHGPLVGHGFTTEEQPPAADATALSISECEGGSMCHGHPRQDTGSVHVVDASFRDSGGFPILPPYTPPAP